MITREAVKTVARRRSYTMVGALNISHVLALLAIVRGKTLVQLWLQLLQLLQVLRCVVSGREEASEMRVRITSGPAKVGYVVLAYILMIVAGMVVAVAGWPTAAQFLMLALGIASLLVAVRTFRGPSESLSAARARWRMTERPASGYAMAVFFAIQAVAYLATPGAALVARLIASAVSAVVAIAFVRSSRRLARPEEHPPA
jgi:hypothetical protein